MKECIALDNIEVCELDESYHEGMYITGQYRSVGNRRVIT